MNDTALKRPAAMRAFLAGSSNLEFNIPREDRYAWLAKTLKETAYFNLRKRDKSSVQEYILRITGYSRQHLARLIAAYRKHRRIGKKKPSRNSFPRTYNREDVFLLAETDQAHNTLSGGATKKLFERAHEVYENPAYERLKNISISHIYNLRKTVPYQQKRRHFTKTQPSKVNIGERRKPNPNGEPGYIRIDTVHQGDQDKIKGVYHINAVDEVTQFEGIGSVEKISERYLIPILEGLLRDFPFEIKGFHSDNGSEYINKNVVNLLNKLLIEFTKSRARHSNDNGLVESKNGSIIRKVLGYVHIPQKYAPLINEFNKKYLVPYVNFHRPCYFAKIEIDTKGKEKKTYPYELMMTPYEKLKSLANVEQYLKKGVSLADLDAKAAATTDLESAKAMQKARSTLFKTIFSDSK